MADPYRRASLVQRVGKTAALATAVGLVVAIALIPISTVIAAYGNTWAMISAWVALSLAVVLSQTRRYLYTRRNVQVQIDQHGVSFDGELVAPHERIRCAALLAVGPRRYIEIGGDGLPLLTIDVDDVEHGHEMLRLLGQDVSQRVLTFGAAPASPWVTAAWWTLLAWAVVMLATSLSGTTKLAALAALFATTVVYRVLRRLQRVDVGADGARFHGPLTNRFLPWDEVLWIARTQRGTQLMLHDERKIRLRVHSRLAIDGNETKNEASALHERIDAARTAHEARASKPVEARLARSGRSIDAWANAIRTLGGGFRSAALGSEDLERVLEDATARPSARAAAAVALRKIGDRFDARIRTAASSCAEPRLRVALARAADASDDEGLRAALSELESVDEASHALSRARDEQQDRSGEQQR